MRILLLIAMLVGFRIWPEQTPWIAVAAAAVFILKSIEQEEKAKARVRELERELGYVVKSRRTVKDLLRNLPVSGEKAGGLSDGG